MSKKVLSIMLVVCLMLIAATPTFAVGIEDNLITHYDFEGDTFEAALKDKATAGKAKDDLVMESKDATVPAASDFTWDKENGTLANLKDNVGLKATLSDDFKVNSANGTYFFRFKVTGGTGETGLFDIRTSSKRALAIGYKADGNKINVYAGYNSGNKNTKTICTYDITNQPFVNIAVTFEKSSSDSLVKYYVYTDGDAAWTLVEEQTMAGGSWEIDSTTIPRVFGTCFGAGATGRYVADDIRIYNKVLTKDELSDVILEVKSEYAPIMENGAAVRLVSKTEGNGIRFTSYLTSATLEKLMGKGASDIKFGTLIAPIDYVEKAEEFTIEDMGKNFRKRYQICQH